MTHPYADLPDRQFWKRDPALRHPEQLDPGSSIPFRIAPSDRIVTAGSCFAQHLARKLAPLGLSHFVTEVAHPIIPPSVREKHNYGLFSARYGNVYTPRQLLQLVKRATGQFQPVATAWKAESGPGVVDPFRPGILPGGYTSAAEILADRQYHLTCVRRSLAEMDVFVFTLGLTECWEDVRDGAIFPIAPGVAGGTFDPAEVRFRNFDETECWSDLERAITLIREINPTVRIVLTVSPVPLAATYENRHVLLSTTWSKAVLRVVAEKAARRFDLCAYFPSYEIITAPHVRGRYFAGDCREVLPAGVDHVMRAFRKTFVAQISEQSVPVPVGSVNQPDHHLAEMARDMELLCDELMLDERARSVRGDIPPTPPRAKPPNVASYRLSPWAARLLRLLSRK